MCVFVPKTAGGFGRFCLETCVVPVSVFFPREEGFWRFVGWSSDCLKIRLFSVFLFSFLVR